jgi:hypothetical protein
VSDRHTNRHNISQHTALHNAASCRDSLIACIFHPGVWHSLPAPVSWLSKNLRQMYPCVSTAADDARPLTDKQTHRPVPPLPPPKKTGSPRLPARRAMSRRARQQHARQRQQRGEASSRSAALLVVLAVAVASGRSSRIETD